MPFGAFPPTSRRRVVVTGIGMVTPLGIDAATTWSSLCAGRTGTCALSEAPHFLPTFIANNRKLSDDAKQAKLQQLLDAMPCKVVAAVRDDLVGPALAKSFAPSTHEPRSFRLCEHAVAEALCDAKLLDPNVLSALNQGKTIKSTLYVKDLNRVGVNIGMGIPSLADVADVSAYLFGDPQGTVHYSKINPFFVPKILGNMAAGAEAIRYGIAGPIGSSVAACATGAHCVGESMAWIREGRADIMVCGATEACITPISMGGFARMRALCTKYNTTPAIASRPFDKDRGGFIMGEGAGILVLEDLEHAKARGAAIYAEVRGFGVASDAHHVAAPHPEGRGARRCLTEALRDGGNVPSTAVGHVNAHATGTIGDDIELAAIESSFRGNSKSSGSSDSDKPLLVTSSKGALGHLLGAAGSVEAGIAVLSLAKQLVPPVANLENPCITEAQKAKGIALVQGDAAAPLLNCEAVVSASFGFGGINTALLFTRVEKQEES